MKMKKIKILTLFIALWALIANHVAIGKTLPLLSAMPSCNCTTTFSAWSTDDCDFVLGDLDAGVLINTFYIDVPHLSAYIVAPINPEWTSSQLNATTDRFLWTSSSGSRTGLIDAGLILSFNSTVLNGQPISYAFSNDGGINWFCMESHILPPCGNIPCNTATFTPSGPPANCCYDITINATSAINEFYVDVPYSSTNTNPPNTAGWTTTFIPGSSTTPDRYLWTLASGSFTGTVSFGTFCFNNSVVNGQPQTYYGFSNNSGADWFCKGIQALPICGTTLCTNYATFTPFGNPNGDCCFRIAIDGSLPVNGFYIDVPHLSTWGNPPSVAGWTATFTSNSSPGKDRYLWTHSGSVNGHVDFSSLCFNGFVLNGQPLTGGFSNDGGTTWFCVNAQTLTPPCDLCNDIATLTPSTALNVDCCFEVNINAVTPINAFYVDVPISSTYPSSYGTIPNSPVGWTRTFSASTATTDRYLWTYNSGNFTGIVLLGAICFSNNQSQQVSYGFSNVGGGAWFCSGISTLPICPAPCNIQIQANPPIICDNQGSTITSAGYSGTGTILWYQSTTNPGTTNAPSAPWVLTGSSGMSINTGNLTCNPPSEVTKYWYMAILTDPLCTVSPVYSNIVTVTVDPIFTLTVTGDMILCTGWVVWDFFYYAFWYNILGGSTTLTLNGMSTNTSCPIIWMDLQTNTQIVPIANTNSQQISLGPLWASVADCPFKMYYYNVSVCNGICNPTIPIAIKVYSRSKATNIAANQGQLCWGQDTKVHLIDHNYCGDIQWQIKSLVGTGGLWIDIPGATNTLSWNTNHLIEDTYYRVRFTNGVCPPAYSNEVLVSIQPQVSAVVSYFSTPSWSCGGLLCSTVSFTVVVNPPTASWQWYKNGIPIPGSDQTPTYSTSDAGEYSVVVGDPLCGNVSSNTLSAFPMSAMLIGPSCVCFNPASVFNLTVVPDCGQSGPFTVTLYNNNISNVVYSSAGLTPDSDGNIILSNIHLSPGDKFWVKISGLCGEVLTNFYVPDGCNCPQ